jgi:hypothetical protein
LSSTSASSSTSSTSSSGSTTQCVQNSNIYVKITASVPGAPGSFDLNVFVTNLAGLLSIPIAAINEAELNLDQSTSTRTVIAFRLTSVNCIDPVAKALELKNLAESQNPRLGQFGLSGFQIVTVEEQEPVVSQSVQVFPTLSLILVYLLLRCNLSHLDNSCH